MSHSPGPLPRRLGLSPAALRGAWLVAAVLGVVLAAWFIAQPRIAWDDDSVVPSRARLVSRRVDPRTACRASLVRLPGVGPATADAIIHTRRTLGLQAVATEKDLLKVPGIGPLRLKAMRPLLDLADPCGVAEAGKLPGGR